jgi:TolB protein
VPDTKDSHRGYQPYLVDPENRRSPEMIPGLRGTRPTEGWGPSEPAWSPDGRRLACSLDVLTDDVLYSELYVYNFNGSEKKQLTRLGGFNASPAWSPDGKQIAFIHGNPKLKAVSSIYVVDADGKNPREVIQGTDLDWTVGWMYPKP